MTGSRAGRLPRAVAVTDIPEMRTIYAEILADEGYEVVTLGWDGATLAAIDAAAPDFVVVDCAFGGPNASAVVAQAIRRRAHLRTIPHLICTTDAHLAATADLGGPVAVLAKPFDLDQICEIVRRLRRGESRPQPLGPLLAISPGASAFG